MADLSWLDAVSTPVKAAPAGANWLDAGSTPVAASASRPAPPTVYDAALFKQRVGRAPEPAELANFQAQKGAGFAGDPNAPGLATSLAGAARGTVGLAENAVAGAAQPAMTATAGLAGLPVAAYDMAAGTNHAPDVIAAIRGAVHPVTQAGQGLAAGAAVAADRARRMLPDNPAAQTFIPAVADLASNVLGARATIPSLVNAGRAGLNSVAEGAAEPSGVPAPANAAQQIVSQQAAASPQNVGAATAAARVASASPELQQAVVQAARRNGGAVNPDALVRHLEAESLPVPVKLTEGEALQDPTLISQEKNARGVHEDLANHQNVQNKALTGNLDAIRDNVGPDVFSANTVEHGEALINAYKAKDDTVSKGIDAAYDAAREAIPDKAASVINAPQLLADVTKNLHEQLLFDSAPPDVMRTLGRLAENNSMTFGNLENLRTNLARIMRSPTADGNAKYAAGIIRNTVEQAPLATDNAAANAAFTQARTLARSRFQALEQDPAYKAAVYGTVEPDKFMRRFVINGDRDPVAAMQANLKDNPVALQTNAVAVLDHLKQVSVDNNGNFSPARFNKALAALDPKLRSLLDPKTIEQLETLGRVGTYMKGQPSGSFVANSNTPVALANMMQSAGGKLATEMLPTSAKLIVKGAQFLGKRAAAKSYVARVTAPGAGIDRLATPPKVQAMIDAARLKAQVTP